MERSYAAGYRACATCIHWFGPRRVHLGGSWVVVRADVRAACNHPNRLGMATFDTDSCGRWERHGSLRR